MIIFWFAWQKKIGHYFFFGAVKPQFIGQKCFQLLIINNIFHFNTFQTQLIHSIMQKFYFHVIIHKFFLRGGILQFIVLRILRNLQTRPSVNFEFKKIAIRPIKRISNFRLQFFFILDFLAKMVSDWLTCVCELLRASVWSVRQICGL